MGVHLRALAVSAALLLSLAGACSNSTPPAVHPGDDLTNATNDVDTGASPPTPAGDSGMDDASLYGDSSFQPMLGACATCSCSPKKSFCFGGGVDFDRPPVPLAGHGDGGGDASDASDDSGTPSCPMVGGGKVDVGCNSLPAVCAASPTCDCVLNAIQSQFACYLVCTPDEGYLLVYCPNGP